MPKYFKNKAEQLHAEAYASYLIIKADLDRKCKLDIYDAKDFIRERRAFNRVWRRYANTLS